MENHERKCHFYSFYRVQTLLNLLLTINVLWLYVSLISSNNQLGKYKPT